MNKKLLLPTLLSLLSAGAWAQIKDLQTEDIDWEEDTAKVVSIDDILKMQQNVSTLNDRQIHFSQVWGYRTFLNVSYTKSKLSPKSGVNIEYGPNQYIQGFKNDWGVSMKWGNNYRLHKAPISNIVAINLDFVWTDLSVNHYKAEAGSGLYDSRDQRSWTNKDDETDFYHYLPWRLEKYEFTYGMALGPSVTVAPFTMLDVRALHFIKINLYYHIGYNASLLLMKNDKGKADANPTQKTFSNMTSEEQTNLRRFEEIKGSQLALGHGLTHCFGFNLSWKFIGVGYEHRNSPLDIMSLNTAQFSSEKYKFKSSSNRFYLQFRF